MWDLLCSSYTSCQQLRKQTIALWTVGPSLLRITSCACLWCSRHIAALHSQCVAYHGGPWNGTHGMCMMVALLCERKHQLYDT